MISLHEPESDPRALAHGWRYPWSDDPTDWFVGELSPRQCSLEAMAQAIVSQPWSPGRFEFGHRHESNFIGSSIIALDFDEGKTLDWAIAKFARLRHIIATTKSHGIEKGKKPPCDRFRVVLFLPYCYTFLPLYKSTMAAYVELLGADEQVKDGARFFWPSRDIISVRDGFTCPELRSKKAKPKSAEQAVAPVIRKWEPEEKRFDRRDPTTRLGCRAWASGAGYQEGIRNRSCFQAACDLFEAGWSEGDVAAWIHKIGTSLDCDEVSATIRSARKKKEGM